MAYENEAKAFAENNWDRLSYTRNQKTGVRELVRICKANHVPDVLDNSALEYLATCISGGAEGTNVTAASYIDNPRANKRPYPGRWRLASVAWSAQLGAYVETLRHGYATAVLTGTPAVLNDECRILTANDQRADSRAITVAWHSIAESAVLSCVDALRTAGSFTAPTIQGNAFTGQTLAVDVITPQQAEDGSYTITAQLMRVVGVGAITDLTNAIRQDVLDVENPFGLAGGYTAHAGRKLRKGITLTYRALAVSSRATLAAFTSAQLQALAGGSYETVKATVEDDVGNTLKFVVVFAYIPLATTAPESAARLISFGLNNQSSKIILKRRWDRMDPAYVQAIINGTDANPNTKVTSKTVTDPQADGKTYSGVYMAKLTQGNMTAGDGCALDQELTLSGDADVDVFMGDSPDVGSYTKYLYDASETAVNGVLGATTFPDVPTRPAGWAAVNPAWNTSQVGITKAHKITNNPDGSLNLWAFYSSAVGLQHVELFTGSTPGKLTVDPNASQSDERAWGWNIPIADLKTYSDYYKNSATASENVNKLRQFNLKRRDTHTFDFEGVITTLSPIETEEHVISESGGRTIKRKSGEHLTEDELVVDEKDAYGPPAGTEADPLIEGDIVKAERVKEPAGGVKASREIETPKLLDTGVYASASDASGASAKRKVMNAKAAEVPNIGDITIGGEAPDIFEQSIERDPISGLRIVEQSGSKETDQPYGGGVSSAVEDVIIIGHTAAESQAVAAAGGVNVISKATNKPTKGGKVASELSTTTKKPIDSGAFVSEKNALLTKTSQILLNQAAVPPAGDNEKVIAKENGAGGWDVTKIKAALASGLSVKTFRSESLVNQDPKVWQEKVPSRFNGVINGYLVFFFEASRSQTGRETVERVFSLSMPSCTPSLPSVAGSDGSSAKYKNEVVPVGDGLWCVEKTSTTWEKWSEWATKSTFIATLAP